MPPARIAIAAQQGLVIRIQEEDIAVDGRLAQVLDEAGNGGEVRGTVTRIQANGSPCITRLRVAHQMRDEGIQEPGWQVVHAVVAEVFKHVQGHGLARAGQAADDDQTQ